MSGILDANPRLPYHIEQMVAELLACYNPDKKKLREHRLKKLASFPADQQPAVKAAFNRVLQTRSRTAPGRSSGTKGE